MKSHSSKETRVAQNKNLLPLFQDEMIVFLRAEPGWLGPQFAAHAEVNSNPVSAGKFEKHLLASGVRTQKPASRQVHYNFPGIAPAKNPFPRMELHRDNLLAETAVPLPAKKLHLSQFGHRAK